MGEYDADLALFGEYVAHVEGVPYHEKWVRQAVVDAPRWAAFRDALLDGATPAPPTMATRYGRALVAAGRQHMSISRIIGTMVPPSPVVVDPYTYRFATFHPTTDKIGGTLNRFNYPSNSYWWVPGQAEPPSLPGASLWAKGGGIFPTSHGTYGPGFQLKCDEDMTYQGAGDSRIVRLAIDPDQPDKFPTPIPFSEGTIQRWEWTWRRPSGQTWPSGALLEGKFFGFFNNGNPSVGHHLYLDNNWQQAGPFHYYIGRQVSFTPPTGAFNNWQRTHCPIAFNEDEYHSIRWETRYSTGGSGYMRAWTSVNGGAMQQWMDHSGATIPSGFGGCYAIDHDIRPPFGPQLLTLEVYNYRLTLL